MIAFSTWLCLHSRKQPDTRFVQSVFLVYLGVIFRLNPTSIMIVTPLGSRIIVRFRKPIWMATAPSKLFRIAEHTFYSPEEVSEIKKLDIAHKHQMRSLNEFMKVEFYIPATQLGGLPKEFVDVEKKEDEKILAENNRINAEIAKERESYFTNFMRDMEDKVMELKLSKEEELAEIGQSIDAYVKDQISDPDNFVTQDNIDCQIERAIESPSSYEFFIDKSGKKFSPQKGKASSNDNDGEQKARR